MIQAGSVAPDFTLADHLGRQVTLSTLKGKRHTMLLFYPLDWTPT
jgi:peroxiredoxin